MSFRLSDRVLCIRAKPKLEIRDRAPWVCPDAHSRRASYVPDSMLVPVAFAPLALVVKWSETMRPKMI